jgi:hypothetical protein
MTIKPKGPTPEQVEGWISDTCDFYNTALSASCELVARLAYAAGADEQLRLCVKWLYEHGWENGSTALEEAMRPKPPSSKRWALEALHIMANGVQTRQYDAIRKALESLPDD